MSTGGSGDVEAIWREEGGGGVAVGAAIPTALSPGGRDTKF